MIENAHARVGRLLRELRPEHDFSRSADFIADGLLDSFDVVSLVSGLEAEFGIRIDGLDIVPENFRDVPSIVELLKRSGVAL
jgi:acyl carrier protein